MNPLQVSSNLRVYLHSQFARAAAKKWVCLYVYAPQGLGKYWLITVGEEDLLTRLASQGKPHYILRLTSHKTPFLKVSLIHSVGIVRLSSLIFFFFYLLFVFSRLLRCRVASLGSKLTRLGRYPSYCCVFTRPFIFCPFLDWHPYPPSSSSPFSLSPYDTSLLTCLSASPYGNRTFLLTLALLCVTDPLL